MCRARWSPLLLLMLSAACAGLTPEVIQRQGAAGDLAGLAALLGDPRGWVREEAALAIGRGRIGAGRPELERVLLDRQERAFVRAAAARSLADLEDRQAVPALVGAAAPGAPPELKLAVIDALCRLGGAAGEARQMVALLQGDEDLLVAARAESALAAGCRSGS